ncbi:hypothetical protein [Microbacterium hominis]|uniref:hypothetical protein n=1 Tax=Microbacterium hominis TaxID=162426 RepID=UPI000A995BE5|nr:hypothetical protein [Microbacterium hominis]
MTTSIHAYKAYLLSNTVVHQSNFQTGDSGWKSFGDPVTLVSDSGRQVAQGSLGSLYRNDTLTAGKTYLVSISAKPTTDAVLTPNGYARANFPAGKWTTASFIVSPTISRLDLYRYDPGAGTVLWDNIKVVEIATSLALRSGSLTLDAGRFPHVEGSVELGLPGAWANVAFPDPRDAGNTITIPQWTPQPSTYALLDPRNSPAPRVVITARQDDGNPRLFNLHIRERAVDHDAGVVTLNLASDEGLLQDYAPLADDLGPRAYETSVRSVVNYVLGKAIPGATLEPGTADANMTATWDAENMILDPRFTGLSGFWSQGNITTMTDTTYPGAQDGVAHNGVHLYNSTSADSYISIGGDVGAMRLGMQPGKTYTFSASGKIAAGDGVMLGADSFGRARRLVVHTWSAARGYQVWTSPAVPNLYGATARVAVTFTVPPDATQAWLRAYHGVSGSGKITWGLFRLSETGPGTEADNSVYFWGGKPSSGGYTYSWASTADASLSKRKAAIERLPELFTWKAGVSAMDFLAPLVQAKGFRLVCDEQRRWTLRDETYEAPGSLALRAGINLIEANESISRDSSSWFDARTTRYKWTDENGTTQERVDSYSLTPTYSRMTLLELDAVYPGPGRSEYAVRRAQGVGREVTVSTVSDWTAAAEMPVSVVLENAPTGLGKTQSVSYDLSNDRMTVTTRTVDTPAGAINLLSGTINALTGTINLLS